MTEANRPSPLAPVRAALLVWSSQLTVLSYGDGYGRLSLALVWNIFILFIYSRDLTHGKSILVIIRQIVRLEIILGGRLLRNHLHENRQMMNQV